jgi:hypothetical protein
MKDASVDDLAAACLRWSAHQHRHEARKNRIDVSLSVEGIALADAYTASDYDAYVGLLTMVDDAPDRAWPIITAAIEASPDDVLLNAIGSGMLETFLVEHGAAWFDTVRAQAASSIPFGRALSAVWLDDDPDLARRLRPLVREPHLADFAEYHWGPRDEP